MLAHHESITQMSSKTIFMLQWYYNGKKFNYDARVIEAESGHKQLKRNIVHVYWGFSIQVIIMNID